MSTEKHTPYEFDEPERMVAEEPVELFGGVLPLDENERYTYADYLRWFDDVRRELINGIIHVMSAPWTKHARTTRRLGAAIESYLQKRQGNCDFFYAPFDVRLPVDGKTADKQITTVVQPDICVVCDPSKIDKKGCIGAPDFIIEITSPSTKKHDWTTKFYRYESAGVKEYWIVELKTETIHTFVMQDTGRYGAGKQYSGNQKVPVRTLPGLTVSVSTLFEELRTKNYEL
ncbi:MAG: Uma2 family endonuclease [Bacteroidales bacterium]|jgi:Uma2 family endonuclease|nr:Uma2 family endonuclease [Bacteroidales bacterium]